MFFTSDQYTYKTFWSEEDQEFVGVCEEFPSLSWLDEDEDEARKGIERTVAEVLEDMHSEGEDVPPPAAKSMTHC